jgi:hypothetical protein
MSEVPLENSDPLPDKKPLWPLAVVILVVVFAPAFLAWAVGMLHQ